MEKEPVLYVEDWGVYLQEPGKQPLGNISVKDRACEKTLGAQAAAKIYLQIEKGKRKHEHQSPMLEFEKEMS